mmetsp:Transcript_22499/g.41047  ORF Transcript_22499/g.41047 Transcript_22499/m.41047 type:complete len:335 (+) Transcript_22499:770-1774(+)
MVNVATLQKPLTARCVLLATMHNATVEKDYQVSWSHQHPHRVLGRIAQCVKLGPRTIILIHKLYRSSQWSSRAVIECHALQVPICIQSQHRNFSSQEHTSFRVLVLVGLWRVGQHSKSFRILTAERFRSSEAIGKHGGPAFRCTLQAVQHLHAWKRITIRVVCMRPNAAICLSQIVALRSFVHDIKDGPVVRDSDITYLVANFCHHSGLDRDIAQHRQAVPSQEAGELQLASIRGQLLVRQFRQELLKASTPEMPFKLLWLHLRLQPLPWKDAAVTICPINFQTCLLSPESFNLRACSVSDNITDLKKSLLVSRVLPGIVDTKPQRMKLVFHTS